MQVSVRKMSHERKQGKDTTCNGAAKKEDRIKMDSEPGVVAKVEG